MQPSQYSSHQLLLRCSNTGTNRFINEPILLIRQSDHFRSIQKREDDGTRPYYGIEPEHQERLRQESPAGKYQRRQNYW